MLTLVIGIPLFAQQQIYGMGTVYDDSFREWIVFYDDDQEGSIELKWPLKNDWSQWEINVGDAMGSIKSKGAIGTVYWESKINNQIISVRPVFPRDLTQWIIKSGDEQVRLKMVYNDTVENWSIEYKDGYFDIFTTYMGDVRDWSIEDTLLDQLSYEVKLTAMNIVLYYSCPRQ